MERECSQFRLQEEGVPAGDGPGSHTGKGAESEPGQGEWPVCGLRPREGAGTASSRTITFPILAAYFADQPPHEAS